MAWGVLESEIGEIEREMGGEEVGGHLLFTAMGDVYLKNRMAFIHTYTRLSDTQTPTHYPPLLSHIGCLSSLKGHLCVNNSTLLLLYLEWLSFYIERGGGFMLSARSMQLSW